MLGKEIFQADSLKELSDVLLPSSGENQHRPSGSFKKKQTSFLSNSMGRLPLVRRPDSKEKCPSEVWMGGINANESEVWRRLFYFSKGLGEQADIMRTIGVCFGKQGPVGTQVSLYLWLLRAPREEALSWSLGERGS